MSGVGPQRVKELSLELVEWLYQQDVNDTEALLVLQLALHTGSQAMPTEAAVAQRLRDLIFAEAGLEPVETAP